MSQEPIKQNIDMSVLTAYQFDRHRYGSTRLHGSSLTARLKHCMLLNSTKYGCTSPAVNYRRGPWAPDCHNIYNTAAWCSAFVNDLLSL